MKQGNIMKTPHYRWLDYAVLTCAFFLIVHNVEAPHFLNDDSYYRLYASNAGTGSISKQVGIVILFAYGCWACLFTRKKVLRFDSLPMKLGLAFFFLITISVSWSAAPSASFARWSGFATYMLAAVGALKRLSAVDLVRWYVLAHCSYLLIGFLNEVHLGTFSLFGSGYRFSGISDPNATGADALVLVFSSIAMLRVMHGSWLYRVTLVIAIVFLILTRSRTAILSTVFTLIIYYGIVTFRGGRLALYLYVLGTLASLALVLNSLGLVNFTGELSLGRKEASKETMTGRIPLWRELYDTKISSHPLLGYGYGGSWTPEESEMNLGRPGMDHLGSAFDISRRDTCPRSSRTSPMGGRTIERAGEKHSRSQMRAPGRVFLWVCCPRRAF